MRNCILIAIVLNSTLLFSQNKEYNIDLPLLSIVNMRFDSIVNNVIIDFKKCEWYSKSKVFFIVFTKKENDSYLIHIEPVDDQQIVMNDFMQKTHGKPFGYLLCLDHLLIFNGTNPKDLFKITNTKKKFIINAPYTISAITDYTRWFYSYKNENGKLEFIKKEFVCNKE